MAKNIKVVPSLGIIQLSGSNANTSISVTDDGQLQFGESSNTGSLNVTGDLVVQGSVTAQEFKTEFVSASIIYRSGSTKFGDTADDNHSFTGSLELTGSLTVSETGSISYITGNRIFISNNDDGHRIGRLGIDYHSGNSPAIYSAGGTFIRVRSSIELDNSANYIQASSNHTGDLTFKHLRNGDFGYRFQTTASGSVMRIDGSGNVGIGTTNPSEKLHVSGNLRIETNHRLNLGSTGLSLMHTGTYGEITNYTGDFIIRNTAANEDIIFKAEAGTGTDVEVMRIDGSSGNVGIGTTSPSYQLDVSGSVRTTDTLHFVSDNIKYVAGTTALRASGNFESVGTLRTYSTLRVDSNADIYGSYLNVGRGLSTAEAALTVGGARTSNGYSYIDLVGDTTYTDYGARFIRGNTGTNASTQINHRGTGVFDIQTVDSAPIRLVTSGSERVRVTSDGKVGIGTASPSEKLTVAGNILQTSNSNFIATRKILGRDSNGLDLMDDSGANGISIKDGGRVQFTDYGSGTFTGTPAYRLSVDSSGNIIEESLGAGAVDGLGSGDYITRWEDTDTITSSSIYENNGNIGIGTTNPGRKLHVSIDVNDEVARFTSTAGNDAYIELSNANSDGYSKYGVVYNDFVFIPSGSETVRFTDEGRVGIGTTSPTEELHVVGEAIFQGPTYSMSFLGGSDLRGSNQLLVRADNSYLRLQATNNNIYHQAGADHLFEDVNQNKLVAIKQSGNVGIGTTTPQAKLDVSGSAQFHSVDIFKVDATANPRLRVGRYDAETLNFDVDDLVARIYHKQDETGSSVHKLNLTVDSDSTGGSEINLGFRDNDGSNESTKLIISSSGNVGIGTSTPTAKLEFGDTTSGYNQYIIKTAGQSGNSAYQFKVDGQGNATANKFVLRGGSNFLAVNSGISELYGYSGIRLQTWSGGLITGLRVAATTGNILIGHETDNGYKLDVSGSANISGDLIVTGSIIHNGDLTVTGTVTAQEFKTEFVSASIIYQSGSTKFGDTSDDTHSFTGSVAIDGKLDIAYNDKIVSHRADGTEVDLIYINNETIYIGEATSAPSGITVLTPVDSGQGFEVKKSNATDTAFFVENNGNVGIGTSAPQRLLDVNGNVRVKQNIFGADGNYVGFFKDGGAAIPVKVGSLTISNNYNDIAPSYGLYVQGDAGIGTTAPAAKLEVRGSLLMSGSGTLTAGNLGGTRIDTTQTTISGYYAAEAYARFLIGRDVFAGGQAGIALGGAGGYSYIGTDGTNGNALIFSTDGSNTTGQGATYEKMRIDSSGRLLINATSTAFSDKLYINNNAYTTGGWRIGTATTYVGALQNSGGAVTLLADTVRDIQFTHSNYVTPSMFIEGTTQNVGIGTTTPQRRLHLSGSYLQDVSTADGSVFQISSSAAGALQPIFDIRTVANGRTEYDFNLWDSSTHKFQILADNAVTLQQIGGSGGLNLKGNLSTSLLTNYGGELVLHRYGALSLNNDDAYAHTPSASLYVNRGLYNNSTDYLFLLANQGADKMAIDLDGNVGIGTTSPAVPLHVSGTFRHDGSQYNIQLIGGSEIRGSNAVTLRGLNSYAAILAAGSIFHTAGTDHIFRDTNSNALVTIKQAGNVGIGVNNPSDFNSAADNLVVGTGVGSNGISIFSGTNSAGGIYFADESGSGAGNRDGVINYNHSTATMDLKTGGNQRVLSLNTGTSTFHLGDVVMENDLTVKGIVTAQEFHTEFVSASIVYSSGSTKFGDTSDDIHQFTGSLEVSGSINSANIRLDVPNLNLKIGNTATLSSVTGAGQYNTAIGQDTGQNLTTGYNFTGLGYSAGKGYTTGNSNVSLGNYTGPYFGTSNGVQNVLVGSTIGAFMTDGASENVGVGGGSLYYNTSGAGNTALGRGALQDNATGSYNTAVGYRSAVNIKGDNNIGIGANSMSGVTLGSNNIVIGDLRSGVLGTTLNGVTAIGSGSRIDFYANSTGVGIGTTSPSASLSIGDGTTAGVNVYLNKKDNNTAGYYVVNEGNPSGRRTFIRQTLGEDAEVGTTSTNNLSFLTNDTVRVYIDGDNDNGNVGIGTTTPSGKLEVQTGYIISSGSGAADLGFVLDRAGLDTYQIRHLDGGLTIFNATDSRKEMTFLGNGNVGIGTNSPNAGLEIATAENSTLRLTRNSNTGNYLQLQGGSSGAIYNINTSGTQDHIFQTGGNEKMRLTSAGDLGIGTTSPTLGKVHVVQSSDAVTEGITVEETSGGNTMRLWMDGSTRKINAGGSNTMIEFDTSKVAFPIGKVGIGTSTPEYKLDIQGDSPILRIADDNTVNSPSASAIWMGENGFSEVRGAGIVYDGAANSISLVTSDNGSLTDSNPFNASKRLTVLESNGNVGIGTASPDYKLEVVGTVSGSAFYGDGQNLTNVQRIPKVEYQALTASIATNDVIGLPNGLTYTTSSNGYEYLEMFVDGIRLSRTLDYAEVSTSTVRYLLNVPSGSVVTYKSLTLV